MCVYLLGLPETLLYKVFPPISSTIDNAVPQSFTVNSNALTLKMPSQIPEEYGNHFNGSNGIDGRGSFRLCA